MTANAELLEGMRTLYVRMARLLNDRLRSHGVSLAKLKLLNFIGESPSVRSIDICEEFGFAPRTVTEAVDALEREGLVRRDQDPSDRRAKQISVTAAGQAVILAAAPHHEKLIDQVFETLSPDDEAEFLRIVTALNGRLAELSTLDAAES